MTNLANTILTIVTDLAQISGAIANFADKLLSYILPKNDVAAACYNKCGYCQRIARYVGQRKCQKCCTKKPCITYWVNCNPGV